MELSLSFRSSLFLLQTRKARKAGKGRARSVSDGPTWRGNGRAPKMMDGLPSLPRSLPAEPALSLPTSHTGAGSSAAITFWQLDFFTWALLSWCGCIAKLGCSVHSPPSDYTTNPTPIHPFSLLQNDNSFGRYHFLTFSEPSNGCAVPLRRRRPRAELAPA